MRRLCCAAVVVVVVVAVLLATASAVDARRGKGKGKGRKCNLGNLDGGAAVPRNALMCARTNRMPPSLLSEKAEPMLFTHRGLMPDAGPEVIARCLDAHACEGGGVIPEALRFGTNDKLVEFLLSKAMDSTSWFSTAVAKLLGFSKEFDTLAPGLKFLLVNSANTPNPYCDKEAREVAVEQASAAVLTNEENMPRDPVLEQKFTDLFKNILRELLIADCPFEAADDTPFDMKKVPGDAMSEKIQQLIIDEANNATLKLSRGEKDILKELAEYASYYMEKTILPEGAHPDNEEGLKFVFPPPLVPMQERMTEIAKGARIPLYNSKRDVLAVNVKKGYNAPPTSCSCNNLFAVTALRMLTRMKESSLIDPGVLSFGGQDEFGNESEEYGSEEAWEDQSKVLEELLAEIPDEEHDPDYPEELRLHSTSEVFDKFLEQLPVDKKYLAHMGRTVYQVQAGLNDYMWGIRNLIRHANFRMPEIQAAFGGVADDAPIMGKVKAVIVGIPVTQQLWATVEWNRLKKQLDAIDRDESPEQEAAFQAKQQEMENLARLFEKKSKWFLVINIAWAVWHQLELDIKLSKAQNYRANMHRQNVIMGLWTTATAILTREKWNGLVYHQTNNPEFTEWSIAVYTAWNYQFVELVLHPIRRWDLAMLALGLPIQASIMNHPEGDSSYWVNYRRDHLMHAIINVSFRGWDDEWKDYYDPLAAGHGAAEGVAAAATAHHSVSARHVEEEQGELEAGGLGKDY